MSLDHPNPLCNACGGSFTLAGLSRHHVRTKNEACRAHHKNRVLAAMENDTLDLNVGDPPVSDQDGDLPSGSGRRSPSITGENSVQDLIFEDEVQVDEEVIGVDTDPPYDDEIDDDWNLDDGEEFQAVYGDPTSFRPPSPAEDDALPEAGLGHQQDDLPNQPDGLPIPDHIQQPRIIVQFRGDRAGAPVGRIDNYGYKQYDTDLGGGNINVWAPFRSKVDWEIAKWAKFRGPSSTALSELLKIDDVSDLTSLVPSDVNCSQVCLNLGLSYGDSRELNQIIDKKLPGVPSFKCSQVKVQNETLDLYHRDIIQCIKALYGNPEFTPYLVYLPERHYADDDRTIRVYHEMHTGKWWWATQVRYPFLWLCNSLNMYHV
jgi:hypothetical protein